MNDERRSGSGGGNRRERGGGHRRALEVDRAGHGRLSSTLFNTSNIDGEQLPSSDVRFTHSDLCVNSGLSRGNRTGADGGEDHVLVGDRGDPRGGPQVLPRNAAVRHGGVGNGYGEAREGIGEHVRPPEQRGSTSPKHEDWLVSCGVDQYIEDTVNVDMRKLCDTTLNVFSGTTGGDFVEKTIVDDRANQPGHPPHRDEERTEEEELSSYPAVHPKGENLLMCSESEDGNLDNDASNVSELCIRLHGQGAKLSDPNQEQANGLQKNREHSRRRGAGEGALARGSSVFLARRAGQHAARGSCVGGARGSAPPGSGVAGDRAA